jgi:hypothetical protein
MVGSYATRSREPGQARKGAALSGVPSVPLGVPARSQLPGQRRSLSGQRRTARPFISPTSDPEPPSPRTGHGAVCRARAQNRRQQANRDKLPTWGSGARTGEGPEEHSGDRCAAEGAARSEVAERRESAVERVRRSGPPPPAATRQDTSVIRDQSPARPITTHLRQTPFRAKARPSGAK